MSLHYVGLLVSSLAFLLTVALTPLLILIATRQGWVDLPGVRKVHKKAVPRLGGVALFPAIWLGWSLFVWLSPNSLPYEATVPFQVLFVASSFVWLLGIYDDIRGANAWQKLIVQTLAAAAVVYSGIEVRLVHNPMAGDISVSSPFWIWVITVGWIVFVSNSINLIDGLDGLASGVCFITSITLYFIARDLGSPHLPFFALSIAGACLGFLVFNFSPARIFLGDSGSLLLGFLLGVLSIMGTAKRSTAIVMFGPPIIFALPVADTFLAIARRLLRRLTDAEKNTPESRFQWNLSAFYSRFKEVFQADQEHIHHALLKIGLSHRRAAILLYAVTALLGVTAYRSTVSDHLWGIALVFAFLAMALVWLRRRVLRS